MDLDYDELGDYHWECYERYLRDSEQDPEGMGVRQWDVARYNPYAAYMFASRMENGELAGDAGNYYQKAAELGCSRAVWKVVANPSFMRGVRHTCVMFDRCVNHHSVRNGEDRGSAIRQEAETYSWRQDPKDKIHYLNEAVDGNDHAMDAINYGAVTHLRWLGVTNRIGEE